MKLPGLRDIAPHLLRFLSDEKTLFTALTHMKAKGSHAPGPDGLRFDDIRDCGEWKWCRAIRDDIRIGSFRPDEEQLQRISKGPGRGYRELVVQSIEDRVVHRAAVEILQPLLDPLFDPRSFGYRPRKGPLRALATAENLFRNEGLTTWVSVDIRNAFPSVPIGRLLGVVRKYLPDGELINFLKVITQPDKTPGLRQGSPLSPLLLNVYLHHVLDREWRKRMPQIPLLRFADDVLLLCRTPAQARDAYDTLVGLLPPAGFDLKEGKEDAVRLVAAGQGVEWMGFGIGVAEDGLRYSITDDAWESLAEKFDAAHGKSHSPVAACETLLGWISDKAPCYPGTNKQRAYDRMMRLAAVQGFDEMPDRHEVEHVWQRAYARWCKLRKGLAASSASK